jgi:hypothetical protein
VRGLVVTGGGVRWRSGTIKALGGAYARGPSGYGARLLRAHDVRFDRVLFTDADRGIVLDRSRQVSVTNSKFLHLGQDGIIASASQALVISNNYFSGTRAAPSRCTLSDAFVSGMRKRDCETRGGIWKSGGHPDAVQMRNGVTDVLIERNVVEGPTQGLTQMDTIGDAPLERVVIRNNKVATERPHKITLGACVDCVIANNEVDRAFGSDTKAIILKGQAERCGNRAQDEKSKDAPC